MLSIVGLGYGVAGHATPETLSLIDGADRLFYLVTDPATATWLRSRRPGAVSLHDCYREGEPGLDASRAMVERIVAPLSEGLDVCAAFSGHPGIGMHTGHGALRRAREMGIAARMLPAVSCEDCLVTELGVDPGRTGRMLYEATDFVDRPRTLDPGAALVLLQVGAVGERVYRSGTEASREGLRRLRKVLERSYPPDHEVTLYERSPLPVAESSVVRLPLRELAEGPVRVSTTLYAPPLERPRKDPAILERLGLEPEPNLEPRAS